ncbi:hypothetical protein PFMC_00487, partial [Plasmodium falciparum CAMP/Malaysia]
MQLKNNFYLSEKKDNEKLVNKNTHLDNSIIKKIYTFYKNKDEKVVDNFDWTLEILNNLYNVELPILYKMFDINSICVSLKLKLKIKNNNEASNKNYFLYFDINPGGIMSKNQEKIYYEYKFIRDKNDDTLEKMPREQKMKY